MKNPLIDKQLDCIDLFAQLGTWQNRFQYLIEIGETLPEMPEHLKTSGTRIQGCISRTYFYPRVQDGIVRIQGWSNAVIPAGLIALIREVFDGCTVEDLRLLPAITIHTECGLMDHLTGNRAVALVEMIERVRGL